MTQWIRMPLTELVVPRHGRICVGPSWWGVTKDEHVLFFKSYCSPLKNQDKALVERMWPHLRPHFVEMAFIPHRCSDYV